MSQENVEIFREQTDALRRGDWDAWAAYFDPDIVVRTDPSWPEQFIHGREGLINWFRGVHESLGPEVRIDDIIDLGDRLLVCWDWNTRGQRSGIESALRWTSISTWRERRIVFVEMFLDHAQALKAVGLEE